MTPRDTLVEPADPPIRGQVDLTKSPRWIPLTGALVVAGIIVAATATNADSPSSRFPSSTIFQSSTVDTQVETPHPTTTSDDGTVVVATPSVVDIVPVVAGADLIAVGIADDHYVYVDFRQGQVVKVPLTVTPTGLGLAENRRIYLHDEAGHVEFFNLGETSGGTLATNASYFAPSVTPGRVWVSVPGVDTLLVETDLYGAYYGSVELTSVPGPDPRFRYAPGGGTYQMTPGLPQFGDRDLAEPEYLGKHLPVASSSDVLVGQICDPELVCRLELLDLAADPSNRSWEFVAVVAPELTSVDVSADGQWIAITTMGEGAVVLRRPEFAQVAHYRNPDATAVAFAPFSAFAVVIEPASVQILDGESGRTTSTDVPAELLAGVSNWIVVPNWLAGGPADDDNSTRSDD